MPESYFNCLQSRQWDHRKADQLKYAVKDSTEILQRLRLTGKLEVHAGCVNTLSWNHSGTLLLSGSDDHKLVLTNPFTQRKVHEVLTSHRANIFSAKFLPETGDNKIVSCAGDGTLLFTDILREAETACCQYNCHAGTVYDTLTIPGDPNTFLSCGEDGTVRWFDLRTKSRCEKDVCKDDILINCGKAVTAISLNPILSYQLAVGCSDSKVRIFDRRQLGTQSTGHTPDTTGLHGLLSRFSVPDFGDKMRRLTCVSWRPDGQEILASYSSDYIYVFDPNSDCEERGKKLKVGNPVKKSSRRRNKSPQPFKKLRLRGDWSDTGPHSRPETEARTASSSGSASVGADGGDRVQRSEDSGDRGSSGSGSDTSGDRESYQISLMQRMTDALSRMLNDPSTRLAMQRLNSQGEGGELAGAGGHENREPRQEHLGARPRIRRGGGRGGGHDPSHSQQSRAASAIQDRWRRYKQRKAQTKARDKETDNDSDSNDDDNDDNNDAVVTTTATVEKSSKCSPTEGIFCCRSGKVKPEDDDANNDNSSSDHNEGDDDDMVELQDSVADLQSSGVEPSVELRYSDQGTEASTITASVGSSSSVSADQDSLPGPSRVVTGPVQTGFDPTTGARRRRSGISSVPTSAILPNVPDTTSPSQDDHHGHDVVEYETSDDSDDDYDFDDSNDVNNRIIKQPPVLRQLTGHRNARTMIKEAAWWGNRFILSGSDCGHMFAWDRTSGRLVMMMEADRHVVNCVQPHPTEPILATSGIDYDVKLWTPTAEQPLFDQAQAEVVMRRNEVMLEETRDTITVPASLMIRMLASLNQIRRGQGPAEGASPSTSQD